MLKPWRRRTRNRSSTDAHSSAVNVHEGVEQRERKAPAHVHERSEAIHGRPEAAYLVLQLPASHGTKSSP